MAPQNYYLFGIGICFLFAAFFSFAETALTSLSNIQSEKLAADNGFFNRSLRKWIQKPNQLIATTLVGNTFANTMIAVFGTNYAEDLWADQHLSEATIGVFLTILILVFGEIAPKIIARSHAESVAPFACRVLLGFDMIFYPVTYVITSVLSVGLKSLGIVIRDKRLVTHADIEYMISIAGRQGTIEQDKSRILSSIFQFSKRRVKDIMIPRERISAISVNASLPEVLEFVRQENHSRYPVYNQSLDRIVGFFHARDLFGILQKYGVGASGAPTTLTSFSLRICLRRAFFVSELSHISRVLNEMKSNRIHLAIVKDEWGNVVGLITLEDILEQVFGQIEDEHDDQSVSRPIVDLYSTGIEVDGSENLLDLKTKYDVNIEPGESYSTLNGFLMHYIAHQQVTQKMVIIWRNYVFSILSVKDGEIEKVRITEVPEEMKES